MFRNHEASLRKADSKMHPSRGKSCPTLAKPGPRKRRRSSPASRVSNANPVKKFKNGDPEEPANDGIVDMDDLPIAQLCGIEGASAAIVPMERATPEEIQSARSSIGAHHIHIGTSGKYVAITHVCM